VVKSPPLLRRRRAAGARGAALFVVVLVMTLLMGIGAFAARSAHLATVSSGNVHQQMQSRYVAEYGIMLATSLLSNGGAQSYLKYLSAPPANEWCFGQQGQNPPMQNRTCYKIFLGDISSIVGGNGNAYTVYDPVAGLNGPPGSLGMAQAQCDFSVELSDKVMGATPAGFDTSGGAGKALKFWYVTARATAQVSLVNANPDATAESSGTQTLQGRILAGPFPTN
jgi:hypothetical protein